MRSCCVICRDLEELFKFDDHHSDDDDDDDDEYGRLLDFVPRT